ncbi:MAG TPA: GNAT family N-acetyltransferase [Stellaceae bacterium]|nr:GNAT family N-acetyltransferase [Stellaceae bacterium]
MSQSDVYEVQRDGFTISTDRARLDRDAVYRYLSGESYWAAGLARGIFERSVDGSLPFGFYDATGAQIGYARVVSDGATFAWLSDVYVLTEHRGRGLGRWLVASVMAHPSLQGLRRWMLSTRDAHGLYREFGFGPVDPARIMQRIDLEAHKRDA